MREHAGAGLVVKIPCTEYDDEGGYVRCCCASTPGVPILFKGYNLGRALVLCALQHSIRDAQPDLDARLGRAAQCYCAALAAGIHSVYHNQHLHSLPFLAASTSGQSIRSGDLDGRLIAAASLVGWWTRCRRRTIIAGRWMASRTTGTPRTMRTTSCWTSCSR